jgi:hypothetical protein
MNLFSEILVKAGEQSEPLILIAIVLLLGVSLCVALFT